MHRLQRRVAEALSDATHLLISAEPRRRWRSHPPPSRQGHRARAHDLRWIGYLSTIGVYGDTGGEWMDETATPKPGSDRTQPSPRRRGRLARLRSAPVAKTVQVFRLAGIYGPGRSAMDDLRDGTARRIVKPGQVFNRIHVDDIAAVLETAAAEGGEHDRLQRHRQRARAAPGCRRLRRELDRAGPAA